MEITGEEIEQDNEAIEVITPASYYFKNGKHYILYEEPVEGMNGVIKNRIKITGDSAVEVTKSGITNTHMVFENNKTNVTYYHTPYGEMHIGIHTRSMKVQVKEDLITLDVEYGLDVNHEALADCRIAMKIQPKSRGIQI